MENLHQRKYYLYEHMANLMILSTTYNGCRILAISEYLQDRILLMNTNGTLVTLMVAGGPFLTVGLSHMNQLLVIIDGCAV